MATITQIRGALLEEAVLFLLKKIGYDTVDVASLSTTPVEGMRAGRSGLELRGRGTWHQLDALALWRYSPAFMYPMHLIVEAKCYSTHRPVGVEIPRNMIGVLKDISENYFTIHSRGQNFQAPRYNYTGAIFSTSGFTKGAVEYAIAHQVFLIQYENIPAIQPLINAIFQFDESCISIHGQSAIAATRKYYRECLNRNINFDDEHQALTEIGKSLIHHSITQTCMNINGSYFGMLQGRWPIHLLRLEPLSALAFPEDSVRCKVMGNNRGEWSFAPIEVHPNDEKWFELEFSLPDVVADLVADSWDNPLDVASLKQEYFSYIDLSGVIGGIRRNIRLELDREWIRNYISRRTEN
jgi:hypothetical protein